MTMPSFQPAASVGAHVAKQKFREWDASVTRRKHAMSGFCRSLSGSAESKIIRNNSVRPDRHLARIG